jgi:hypothetical protein
MTRDVIAATVVTFFRDDQNMATGGILRLMASKNDKRSSFRILFDRKDAYFCGASLGKADLEPFFDGESVRLVFSKTELTQGIALQKAKDLIGPAEAEHLMFFKAEMVFLGGHVSEIMSKTQVKKE